MREVIIPVPTHPPLDPQVVNDPVLLGDILSCLAWFAISDTDLRRSMTERRLPAHWDFDKAVEYTAKAERISGQLLCHLTPYFEAEGFDPDVVPYIRLHRCLPGAWVVSFSPSIDLQGHS